MPSPLSVTPLNVPRAVLPVPKRNATCCNPPTGSWWARASRAVSVTAIVLPRRNAGFGQSDRGMGEVERPHHRQCGRCLYTLLVDRGAKRIDAKSGSRPRTWRCICRPGCLSACSICPRALPFTLNATGKTSRNLLAAEGIPGDQGYRGHTARGDRGRVIPVNVEWIRSTGPTMVSAPEFVRTPLALL